MSSIPHDLRKLLDQFGITDTEFLMTGLTWDELRSICHDHEKRLADLEDATNHLLKVLRRAAPIVHSTRGRVKDPDGLHAKIIRKKVEDPHRQITLANYRNEITDLIGLRVLHHYKRDWYPIHSYIKSRWELRETPKAYVREGDSGALIDEFRKWGLRVEVHKAHYRSVHYLIPFELSKDQTVVAEVQVRTLFEEAWSEIDHMIRYPRGVLSPATSDSLDVFNRVSGAADEVATLIHSHYPGWEKAARSGESRLDSADLSAISWCLSLPLQKLRHELMRTPTPQEDAARLDENNRRKETEAKVASGLALAVLQSYYLSPDSGLDRYRFSVDGTAVNTSMFTSPDRIGMKLPLKDHVAQWSDESDEDVRRPDSEYGLRIVRYLRDTGVRFWNAPIYRLRDASFEGGFRLTFSLSQYFRYRFICGLLEDEIVDARINLDDLKPTDIPTRLPPNRNALLPRGKLRAFDERICAGGVAVLCAFRRSIEDDYVLLLHRRSTDVADGRGMISIVPKGIHQPSVGKLDVEVNLYWTVIREIYEEVFGGTDVERLHGSESDPAWFCKTHEAMQAIHSGTYGASVTGTAFGIDSKNGNYILAALVAVPDCGFWERFSSKIQSIWEHRHGEPFKEVSSRKAAKLRELLIESSWSSDALFAFAEGLLELKRRFPSHVSLPDIQIWPRS